MGTVEEAQEPRNPVDREGNVTTCFICKSEYHWTRECPHREETPHVKRSNETLYTENEDGTTALSQQVNMVLLQTDVKEESKLVDLLNETCNSAVLDSGATKDSCR